MGSKARYAPWGFVRGGVNVSRGSKIDPGVYPAACKAVHAYTNNKYKSDEIEPMLVFVWDFGEDDEGKEVLKWDAYIRLTLDEDGYPYLNDGSKLYDRVSSLYGERFSADDADWDIELPGEYNDLEGLMALPHYDERKDEGFRPVVVKSIIINGVNVIGKEAHVNLIENNGYVNVKEASPLPKRSNLRRKAAQVADEDEAPLPV